MKNNELIQLPAGRTYLGHRAIGKLGAEAARVGERAFVLTDEAVWEKIGQDVETVLAQAQISVEIFFHTRHCSPAAYEKVRAQAAAMKADVLIGIGGGHLLDTAKIASDKAGIRSITVPTSAATCAASAWLSVEYTDEGAFVGNYWTEYPPFCTIIDTDIIVKKCPLRYNLAGFVDAMAKYPEIVYHLDFTDSFDRNAYSEVAVETAKQIYGFFMGHQKELLEKFQAGAEDALVTDAVAKAISVTGLVSALACGGKQAAISHLMYSYICCYHPQVAKKYLHGEIVGASLCDQLTIDGFGQDEVEAMRGFLHEAGMPTCLRELGLEFTPEEEERLFEYLKPRLNVSEKEISRIKGIGVGH